MKCVEEVEKSLVRSLDFINNGLSLKAFVDQSIERNFYCNREGAIRAKTRVNRCVYVRAHTHSSPLSIKKETDIKALC